MKKQEYPVTHDSREGDGQVQASHTGGYASGGFSDRGSDPGQGFPEDSMAELDQWADLAAAGDRAFPGGGPPADADSMTYEELCQAHIEAFIQACLCGTRGFMGVLQVWHAWGVLPPSPVCCLAPSSVGECLKASSAFANPGSAIGDRRSPIARTISPLDTCLFTTVGWRA